MAPRPAVPTMFITGKRRQLLAVAIVGLVAVLLFGLLWSRPWDRSTPTPQQTVWQVITAGIDADGVPLETALQAFAYLTGVDVPGVRVPAGAASDDAPTSATGALRWVRGHWDELTPVQRTAVESFTRRGEGDLVIPVTGRNGEAVGGAGRMASLGAGAPPDLAAGNGATADPETDGIADAIHADLVATIAHIGPKLGLPVIREGLFLKDVTLTLAEKDGGNSLWLTQAMLKDDNYSPCNLTVYRNMWSKEAAGQPLSAALHVTLTHEVIHCYQNQVIDDVYVTDLMPAWIMEGTAIWLAGNDTGIVEHMTPGMWRTHILGQPELSLTSRTYDAYGWYALLDHLGRPMWALMADAWRAAATSTGTTRSEMFIDVLDGDADDVTSAWAPSHARESSWNDPWVPYGLGLPPDVRSPRTPVAATGAGHLGSLPDRSNAVYTVTSSEGEIVLVETDGLANANDGAVHNELAFTSRRFCVEGDCICPPRTQRAGERMATSDMLLPFVVAFQAPAGGAGQRISSRSMEQECGSAPSVSPPASARPGVPTGHGPPRCGKRCAGSNGDPHLYTVDGVAYDFQAAGEFTFLRTADGTTEIQVRQEPSPGVELGSVSNNTALAMRVGDRRVVIYATPTGLELRVDGVTRAGTDPIDLGGGRVERYAQGIVIALPDGTVVWAISIAPYGINVIVDASPGLAEEGSGLVGRSGPGFGIPRLPDGTALPKPLDRHETYDLLYLRFADAWRLTDETTLFDYDSGRSTATYALADYPIPAKVAAFQDLDPTKVAAARDACAAVSDSALRDQCAFDVVVTGDAGYVRPYVAVEQVAEEGSAALDPAVGPGTSPKPTEPTANPPVEVLPVLHRLAGSALAPDGTLYVSAVMADRTGRVFAIDPLTGAILREVGTTGAGEVAVAAGSVWVGEFTAPTTDGFGPCSVSRLDPLTLTVEATIPTACDRVWLGTDMAAVGTDLWFEDSTTVDASGAGGTVHRIDGAIDAVVGSGVPVPFADGDLRASATALFYGDSQKGQSRLRPGEMAFVRIGAADDRAFALGYPAGDGLWAVVDGQLGLYSSANGPDGTIDLQDADGGTLVAADADSVFIQRQAASGGTELWRRYLDGRPPASLAVLPRTVLTGYGQEALSYSDTGRVPTFLVGETSVAKLWLQISRMDPNESLLFVQGARLPAP